MAVLVHELDLTEDGDLDAAFVIRAEMGAEAAHSGPAVTPSSVRRQLIGNDTMRRRTLLATVDGDPVGLARMMFYDIEGSRDIVICNIEVRPAHRRAGVGSLLLGHVLDVCREEGTPTVIGTGVLSDATSGFWEERFGLRQGLVERESLLMVDEVDAELMARWVDERAGRAADYRIRHVRGPCPAELRATVATLNTAMNDAPLDDLSLDDEVWTEHEVAAEDEFRRLRGEERWMTIAFAPDGSPAGLSVVVLNDDDPTWGTQGNTVVLAAHRQRGIGRWLKADMWQRLRADRPELRMLLVENAASNDAMLAINEAMGFREVNRYADWQGQLDEVTARLAGDAR